MKTKKKLTIKQWLAIVSWILPLFVAGLIGIFYSQLPNTVPLYYSHPWGKEQLAPKIELFIIPILLFAISAINNLLVWRWRKNGYGFLATVVVSFSLICSLFGLITIAQIINITI